MENKKFDEEFQFWWTQFHEAHAFATRYESSTKYKEEIDIIYKKFSYKILDFFRKKEITPDDRNIFFEITRELWVNAILYLTTEWISFIKNKQVGTEPYRHYSKRIKDIELKLVDTDKKELSEFYNISSELDQIYAEITENLEIEENKKRFSRTTLFIGFVLGVIASIVAAVIVTILTNPSTLGSLFKLFGWFSGVPVSS